MSNPGMPMTPQMRQQQLAQMLQSGMDLQAPQQAPMSTPYAGAANAGNSMLGAMLMKNAQDQANAPESVKVTPQQVGGGFQGWMGRNLPGLSSLFGMGGS